jgi:hypothetical protein
MLDALKTENNENNFGFGRGYHRRGAVYRRSPKAVDGKGCFRSRPSKPGG